MKPQRSCCVCQQSSSPSIHAAICSTTSSMVHPTSCSTARPAPRHLQKSAIPKGFLNSQAEFQLHIKGEASVFKPSAPEFTEPGSRETKKAFILPSPSLSWAAHSQHGEFPRLWVPTPAPPAIPGTCRLWGPPQASPHHAGPPCRGGVAPEETATHLAQASSCPEGHSKCSERKRDQTLPSGSVPAAGKRVLM